MARSDQTILTVKTRKMSYVLYKSLLHFVQSNHDTVRSLQQVERSKPYQPCGWRSRQFLTPLV
jgi:hypothetical protein